MTDWRPVVRRYAAQHPRAYPLDVARTVGCSEAEALAALSDSVVELPVSALEAVLTEVRAWGTIMAMVRNGDAVAEVDVPGDGWFRQDDWINWIVEGRNLHVRISATRRILATARTGRHGATRSLNFVGESGEVFFRIYAQGEAAQARFAALCQAHAPGAG